METVIHQNPIANQTLSQKITALLEKQPVILQLLRFGAIGVLNTALDFLVLNFVSKTLGVDSGFKLGQINIAGFILAVIQSYYWNKYWAFDTQSITLFKNFIRLLLVGGLGVGALALVLLGSKIGAQPSYYLFILLVYVIAEVVLWLGFGFNKLTQTAAKNSFISFVVVSLIGLVINSLLISVITSHVTLVSNADLNKNLAKILATGASLVWNFVGYKLFVFRK